MRVILIAGAIVVIAFSVVADYLWRRWVAERRREHENSSDRRA